MHNSIIMKLIIIWLFALIPLRLVADDGMDCTFQVPENCADSQICGVEDYNEATSELYLEASARGLQCAQRLRQLNDKRIENEFFDPIEPLFSQFIEKQQLNITRAQALQLYETIELGKLIANPNSDTRLDTVGRKKVTLTEFQFQEYQELKSDREYYRRKYDELKAQLEASQRSLSNAEEDRSNNKIYIEKLLSQLSAYKESEAIIRADLDQIIRAQNFHSSYSIETQPLKLVCENIGALQTNLGKSGFDNYPAATDSQNSMFVIEEDSLTFYYPANADALNRIEENYTIIRTGFYNLNDEQKFIEAFSATPEYFRVLNLHRNSRQQWKVQSSVAGNNEDNLFKRIYWYDCITLADKY